MQLIETMRWENGYVLLGRHLDRLQKSAAHFGYPCNIDAINRTLMKLRLTGVQIVRLTLDEHGDYPITNKPIDPITPEPIRFKLSPKRILSTDEYFQHKTTHRRFYDAEWEKRKKCDELIFANERGELTEGTRTNLFIEKDGVLVTPPTTCGVLPGTLRAEMLATGKAVEGILTPQDLTGNPIFLGNSVRGLLKAKLVVL